MRQAANSRSLITARVAALHARANSQRHEDGDVETKLLDGFAWPTSMAATLDNSSEVVSPQAMASEYFDAIEDLRAMQERVRSIRTQHCEPKTNANPRYLALPNVVSNLGKALEDMEVERP